MSLDFQEAEIMPYMNMTPLVAVARAYDELADERAGISLDGEEWPGFKNGQFSLYVLECALMGHDAKEDYVDDIWACLIKRARRDSELWITICAGLALPGLRNATKRASFLAADSAVLPDIESAALLGFTNALQTIDLNREHLCRKLSNQAYIAARRVANDHARYQTSRAYETFEVSAPRPPSEHVDLLLADAVADEAISIYEAELIAVTRVERRRLVSIAEEASLHPSVLSRRRQQAEARLLEWFTSEKGRHLRNQ